MRLIDADALMEKMLMLKSAHAHPDEKLYIKEEMVADEAIELVDSAPTVHGDDPSPWIPVTERLPEEGRVLTAR